MESKEIKKMLKENGIDTKYVSIKHRYCGYSESYDITIKSVDVDINEVEKLIKSFEQYERDERTGEILEGGNTYIIVQYDYNTLEEANNKYNNDIINIINSELKKYCNADIEAWNNGDGAVRISENILIFRDGNTYNIRNTTDYKTRRSGIDYLAETLIQMGKLNEVLGGLK